MNQELYPKQELKERHIAQRAIDDYGRHDANQTLASFGESVGQKEMYQGFEADDARHVQSSHQWQLRAQDVLEKHAREEMAGDLDKKAA